MKDVNEKSLIANYSRYQSDTTYLPFTIPMLFQQGLLH